VGFSTAVTEDELNDGVSETTDVEDELPTIADEDVARADEEATTVVDEGAACVEEAATVADEDAAWVDEEAATDELALLEVPKFELAVTLAPLLTSTSLTMTTLPSVLVTLTSTVVVPNPLEFSKKLYVERVVDCHVLPPSVLTSKLSTA